MSERNQARKEQYKRVRTDFEELEVEDKAVFLLEATVSTLARGIEQFGRVISDQINDAFGRRSERKTEKEAPGTNGPSGSPGGPAPDDFTGGTA